MVMDYSWLILGIILDDMNMEEEDNEFYLDSLLELHQQNNSSYIYMDLF